MSQNSNIDLVLTYVDSSDPVWQESIRPYADSYDESRYRSWGSLKWQFRAIEKNMPFINKVYLVVSNAEQVPSCLDTNKFEVVLHRDIIPQKFLPTFNSTTIEMFLHMIPGLSECFMYSNDDMFPMKPLLEERFFNGDLSPLFQVRQLHGTDTFFKCQCWSSYAQAAGLAGVAASRSNFFRPSHTICPMLKSVCEDVFSRSEGEIMKRCTRFREVYNFNQYLFADYARLAGISKDGSLNNRIFYMENIADIQSVMADETYDVVCFNDNGNVDDYESAKETFCTELQKKFTDKSSFEK